MFYDDKLQNMLVFTSYILNKLQNCEEWLYWKMFEGRGTIREMRISSSEMKKEERQCRSNKKSKMSWQKDCIKGFVYCTKCMFIKVVW